MPAFLPFATLVSNTACAVDEAYYRVKNAKALRKLSKINSKARS